MAEKVKVLITVKTYPLPSLKYGELVCTAGLREDGSFVRLYPIDFRYEPFEKQYKKYQWIEAEVERHSNDNRVESYRPIIETLRLMGEPLKTDNDWAERKTIVLKRSPCSMETLWEMQEKSPVSLGLVRPKEIQDMIIEPHEEEWKPEWRLAMAQMNLFERERKPLTKIPFKFSYKFTCDDPRCKGHKMMNEDWEIGELYLKELRRLGERDKAAQSVRNKFFNVMCDKSKDTHFFVGTIWKFGTWIVIGTFWPPKEKPKIAENDLFSGLNQ